MGAGKGYLKDIGKSVKDLVVDTIEGGLNVLANVGQIIYDSIMSLMGQNQGGGGGGNNDAEVKDFISRPGMPVQPFSKQDTLIGMKDLSGLVGGGGVTIDYSPTYNISATTDRDELRKIFDEHDEKVKRELQSALSYPTNLRG